MRRLGIESLVFAAGLALFAGPTFAAAAPTAPAHMEMSDDGPVMVTPAGMTLYVNAGEDMKSEKFKFQCTNVAVKTYNDQQSGAGPVPLFGFERQKSCIEKWLPYLADAQATPSGDFTIATRPEGGKQWAYRNRPLYLSNRDHKAGDRNGASGSGFGLRGGFRMAEEPLSFPMGLKLVRWDEGLMVATAAERAVYTPRSGHGKDAGFEPILAPAMVTVSGDWSVVDAGAGRQQYAFRGKPVYTAPANLKDWEIADAGGWDTVVFRKSAGLPSDVQKRMSLMGEVYTTKEGRSLYTFNCANPSRDNVRCDDPGDAAEFWSALCGDSKECARRWHPYLAPAGAKQVGEWAVMDVSYPMFTSVPGYTYPSDAPRVKAWTYRGQPVWTYYEDKEAGDIWGNQIKWIFGSNFSALLVPGHSTGMFE